MTLERVEHWPGELLSIFRRDEVEVIRGPAIVGETALMASEVDACRNYAVTMRAASSCILWCGMHQGFGVLVVSFDRKHLGTHLMGELDM